MFIYVAIIIMIKILEFMAPIILYDINAKYIHGKKIWMNLLAVLWYGILVFRYGWPATKIYM